MPRKTIKQRKEKNPTDDKENRVRSIIDNVIGTESPDDLMLMILDVLDEGGKTPKVGKYYTFVYNAKTKNVRYDSNPLVAVTEVYKWGFRAFNYHWNEMRQYTWDEVAGSLYEVYTDELSDLREIPFGNIRLNN